MDASKKITPKTRSRGTKFELGRPTITDDAPLFCPVAVISLWVVLMLLSALSSNKVDASDDRAVKSLLEMRRERVVIQKWDLSCGAAALSTLMTYQLQDPTSEKTIAEDDRPQHIDVTRVKWIPPYGFLHQSGIDRTDCIYSDPYGMSIYTSFSYRHSGNPCRNDGTQDLCRYLCLLDQQLIRLLPIYHRIR